MLPPATPRGPTTLAQTYHFSFQVRAATITEPGGRPSFEDREEGLPQQVMQRHSWSATPNDILEIYGGQRRRGQRGRAACRRRATVSPVPATTVVLRVRPICIILLRALATCLQASRGSWMDLTYRTVAGFPSPYAICARSALLQNRIAANPRLAARVTAGVEAAPAHGGLLSWLSDKRRTWNCEKQRGTARQMIASHK